MTKILSPLSYYDWFQENIVLVCKARYKTPKLAKRMQRDEEDHKECRERVRRQNPKKDVGRPECLSEETSVTTPAIQH